MFGYMKVVASTPQELSIDDRMLMQDCILSLGLERPSRCLGPDGSAYCGALHACKITEQMLKTKGNEKEAEFVREYYAHIFAEVEGGERGTLLFQAEPH